MTNEVVSHYQKYGKDSTVVITNTYDRHRVEPMFSVFKEYIPEGELYPTRELLGEFTDDDTDAEAKRFAKIYYEMVEAFTGKLIIVDHTTHTEKEYIPPATQ